jgi:hypothetical protein
VPEARTISSAALEETTVYVDGEPFKASYQGDKVIVPGATRKIATTLVGFRTRSIGWNRSPRKSSACDGSNSS